MIIRKLVRQFLVGLHLNGTIINYLTEHGQVVILIVVACFDTLYRLTLYGKTDSVALDLTAFAFVTVAISGLNSYYSNDCYGLGNYFIRLFIILGIAFLGLFVHTSLKHKTQKEVDKYFYNTIKGRLRPEHMNLLDPLRRLAETVLEVDVGYRFGIGRFRTNGNPTKEEKRLLILSALRALDIERDGFKIDVDALLIKHRSRYMFFYLAVGFGSLFVVATA